MKLAVIHLSDIHFRKGTFDRDTDADMAHKITAAVKTELIGSTHVLLVVTGDIAFSGEPEEYRYASDWLSELYTFIDDNCAATCWIICAPGNHDVDHSESRIIRSTLVDRVVTDPSLSHDQDVVDECVKEQKAFFDFRAQLEGDEILVHDDPLLRLHRIRDEQSTVQFNILNSAWMSSRNEQQGSLIFPIARYTEELQRPNGYAISVVHHPLNWFAVGNARELRKQLGGCSSVVLCGHEHIPDKTQLHTAVGDRVHFVDGGVLRGDKGTDSSFNVILLDTDAGKIKTFTFRRHTHRYEATEIVDWQEAKRLTGAESARFRLRSEHRDRMDDVGANILHPRCDGLSLKDLFVYPDLLPVEGDISKKRRRQKPTVTAESLLFGTVYSHVILHGDESSGRSALLRMLFSEFYARGKIPLYFSYSNVNTRTVERFRASLARIYAETYDGDDFVQFEQLETADRVLLVDDFEMDERNARSHAAVLEFVRQFAGRAIVVMKGGLSATKYATADPRTTILSEFARFQIQNLGHVKRDELIKRWILLGRHPSDWSGEGVLAKRDDLRAVINTTIGRNLVPSRPIFVLAILQSTDTTAPIAVGRTYGHHYQFLITKALLDCGVQPEDLDAVVHYLEELAFDLFFLPKSRRISVAEHVVWHERFCREYGVRWNVERLRRRLIGGKILALEGTESTYFKYQYTFYFFVAGRLARSLNDEEIRGRVRHICRRLHVDEYANIILFLVHHSKDEFVLETVRDAANVLLAKEGVFSLDVAEENDLLKRINRLPAPLRAQMLEDRDHETEQKQTLQQRDVLEDEERQIEEGEEEDREMRERSMTALDILSQANVAAKTVDLLGQILRNHYGSLRLKTKVEIGADAVQLALRAMCSFVEIFVSEDGGVVDALVEIRREYEEDNVKVTARLSEEELQRWARELVFSLLGSVVAIVIRKVSGALGWDQLRPTLDELVREKGSMAYRMVKMAALLGGPAAIPRDEIEVMVQELNDNPLGFQLLRDLASQRVYSYPMGYGDKQWLAQKLNFSMVGQREADSDKGRRLLPS